MPLSGPMTISGSDESFLHSGCPQFTEFRSQCRVSDLTLQVKVVPRSSASFIHFSEFVDSVCGCGECDQYDEDQRHLVGSTPAEYLWSTTNFGTLSWGGWSRADDGIVKSELDGNRCDGRARGQSIVFYPKISVVLPATAQEEEVRAALTDALLQLSVSEGLQHGGVSKFVLGRQISGQMGLLEELVRKRGSFADAVLPDAHAPITEAGNGCDGKATFATADYFFAIRSQTSVASKFWAK